MKKLINSFLVFILFLFTNISPAAGEILPLAKLTEVENILYGTALSDLSYIERVEKTELLLFAKQNQGSLKARADEIINFVLGNDEQPPLLFIVNALDWTINNRVSAENVIDKLAKLEESIYGSVQQGSFRERLTKLLEISLAEESVPFKRVEIAAGERLKIKLLQEINTNDAFVGQRLPFEVMGDLRIEDCLLLPAGTLGYLEVVEISQAGKFGKDAEIKVKALPLEVLDGSQIAVDLVQNNGEGATSQEIAVGVGLLGSVLLSNPLGLAIGYFVEGKDEIIPAGTIVEIVTRAETEVYGLKMY